MQQHVTAQVAAWARGNRNLPSPNRGSSPSASVTFPTTTLGCAVYLAIGANLSANPLTWVWTDITRYVRFAPGITTRQGRSDWMSTVSTSSGHLVLDNRDGRFTRRNPNSPYFGLLTFNTPIWATVDPGSGPVTRMAMFVNSWPTRWDRSAKESNVPIECAGIMRRLQQGSVLKSPMRRRTLSSDEPTPVAYWPIEDGAESAVISSGLSGGSSMTGVPTFAAGFGGSTGSLDIQATPHFTVFGVATVPSASGFQVECIAQSDAGVDVTFLYIQSGSFAIQLAMSAARANGLPHHFAVQCVPNGGNTDVTTYADGAFGSTSTQSGTVSTSVTVANLNYGPAGQMAHIAIYGASTMNVPTTRSPAANGYLGELATTRIRRLCAEEGVQMVCTSGLSPAMGAQTEDTFINLLRECEAVDQGVLYETSWGLGYQSTNDRTNQAVALALSKTSRHLAVEPEPADDDQRLRNRWTVSRTDGGFAVAQQNTGALGVTSVGLYDDSVDVNAYADTQLGDQAGWRVHLGTVDEDRWPSLALRFHGTPTLIPSWTAMGYGTRVTLSNPPSQMAPDTIDAILEGWTERWDPRTWVAELSTSPYSPYRVGTLAADTGDTSESLLILTPDTGYPNLNAAVGTGDTSWSINSSPLWTTNSESFPRYVMWEGEVIQVTACSGASAPQTWTVVRSVNGVSKSHAAGTTGRIYHNGVLGLA